MTKGQFRWIMFGLAVILICSWLAIATALLSAQASCERGNAVRAHIAHPTRPANCSLLTPVTG